MWGAGWSGEVRWNGRAQRLIWNGTTQDQGLGASTQLLWHSREFKTKKPLTLSVFLFLSRSQPGVIFAPKTMLGMSGDILAVIA